MDFTRMGSPRPTRERERVFVFRFQKPRTSVLSPLLKGRGEKAGAFALVSRHSQPTNALAHDAQAFRLHTLVQDAEPCAVQPRNERRCAVSASRTSSPFGDTRN